jgi:undecaprenyldiphospho-muramoylpentapeptide beta-N-acetylglucosaminyltransferase
VAAGRGDDVWCVIAGGGTAGHVLPAVATAEVLVDRGHDRASIMFVGSYRPIDRELVEGAGFPFHALPGGAIQRRITWSNIRAAWGLLRALGQAVRMTRRWRPAVVVAVGGFASFAGMAAAVVWRIPLVVAEQNARAGLANRLAGRFARSCALPFPQTDLPRGVVTGNPVRAEILAVDRHRDRASARAQLGIEPERVMVLAFAGSLGATRINQAVCGVAARWRGRGDVAIRHVMGSRDWEALQGAITAVSGGALLYQAMRYEDRMDLAMAASDVAVCRAGGTTVAELAVVGLPSILVPLPIAPRDHQAWNALTLVDAGAAVMVRDDELDVDRLESELSRIVDDHELRERMAGAASSVARRDAASAVADLVEAAAR